MSSKYEWGERSLKRLHECHPLLVMLFERLIKDEDLPFDLTILCGHRDKAAQNLAYYEGTSKLKWPKSKHNSSPSMAVDWAPFPIDWDDVSRWDKIGPLIESEWAAMVDEGLVAPYGEEIFISWGGRWRSFPDRPHIELRGL